MQEADGIFAAGHAPAHPPAERSAADEIHDAAAPPRELVIDIYPRGYDSWCGSRAQLEEEGLISSGCRWPQGKEMAAWSAGGFDFLLHRIRPEGFKGPMKAWTTGDYWFIRRTLTAQGRDGFAAARLYEKRRALEVELWASTHEAAEQRRQAWNAGSDSRYQRFRSILIPERKRPGRPAKAAKGAL